MLERVDAREGDVAGVTTADYLRFAVPAEARAPSSIPRDRRG
jgi:hypothetical protein